MVHILEDVHIFLHMHISWGYLDDMIKVHVVYFNIYNIYYTQKNM